MKNTIDEQQFAKVYDLWLVLMIASAVMVCIAVITEKHQANVSRTHQHTGPR